MSQITVLPSQTIFNDQDGETILAAALRNGYNLPHACQSGVCGSCRAKLISGNVVAGSEYEDYVLSKQDHDNGMILLCCNRAEGQVTVEMPSYAGAKALTVRTLPARIASLEKRGNVVVMKVSLPKAPPFVFYAGQYMDILLKDGSRSYSIASSPSQNDVLEMHIRYHKNGLFSPMLFDGRLKEGSIIRLRGPLGSFALNEDADKPILMLATGTGLAPIKSMLTYLAEIGSKRNVHVYHGVRIAEELYDEANLYQLLELLPNARYTPVLSRADEKWSGITGYVQQQAVIDYPNLLEYEIYACGSAAMIDEAKQLCMKHGLPKTSFFSDVFTVGV